MLTLKIEATGNTFGEVICEADALYRKLGCDMEINYNGFTFLYSFGFWDEAYLIEQEKYLKYKKAKDKLERNEYIHGR